MILIGYSWSDIIIGILWVSLTILLLIICYKLLLRFMNRGAVNQADFCELYSLEIEPASGVLPFYFTSDKVKHYRLLILDSDMNEILEIENKECKIGGNIIRFDSNELNNGEYFYCLKTDNQKVMKKMQVKNGSTDNMSEK
mgnify:CR=1 FL=1|jgi:hypothetical protein